MLEADESDRHRMLCSCRCLIDGGLHGYTCYDVEEHNSRCRDGSIEVYETLLKIEVSAEQQSPQLKPEAQQHSSSEHKQLEADYNMAF